MISVRLLITGLGLLMLGLLMLGSQAGHGAEPAAKENDASMLVSFPAVDALPAQKELPPALVYLGKPIEQFDESVAEGGPDHAAAVARVWQMRREQLKALFEHYVYGQAPPPPGISAHMAKEAIVLGGKARLHEIEIKIDGLPDDAPRLHLALFLPAAARGKVPVFLALNGGGNQAVIPDESVTVNDKAWSDRLHPRGSETDFWCVADIIDRGYAFATFHQSDIAPDMPAAGRASIQAWYPELATPQTRWGVLAAWAWGLSRAVDYLVTDPAIDASRLAVLGHSRRGKAALLAGAFDERIWLTVPHQSGTGGCALSRGNDQETVAKINRSFPYWFNGIFPQFAGREERLPVDQHLLVAMVAPRLLLDTEGSQDHWANYESSLRGLREADGVYKFLGGQGMVAGGLLSGDTKLTKVNCGQLLQYRRDEKHALNRGFWKAILDFADAHQEPASPR